MELAGSMSTMQVSSQPAKSANKSLAQKIAYGEKRLENRIKSYMLFMQRIYHSLPKSDHMTVYELALLLEEKFGKDNVMSKSLRKDVIRSGSHLAPS